MRFGFHRHAAIGTTEAMVAVEDPRLPVLASALP
jgi:hypothetical protein